jgi:hypothetical protein
MDPNNEEKGRFPKTSKNYASMLLRIKGTLGGKDITISIAPPNVIIMLVLNSLTS